MQVAPEVIFKDIDRTPWVESYVVERLGHLEKFSPDITRCHVTVAREHGSHRKGNRYSVMVEVRVPRQHDLAVRKQKQIRDMQTQLPATINEAFGAIEKQPKKAEAARLRTRRRGLARWRQIRRRRRLVGRRRAARARRRGRLPIRRPRRRATRGAARQGAWSA